MEKTILIVDDDEMTLMMTESVISTKYRTLKALSGREALDICSRTRPDLILADLMMPEMNGFEMVDILHERFGKSIPVIFMTANESEEAVFQGLGKGAVDYLRKPLKANVLIRTRFFIGSLCPFCVTFVTH